MRPRAVVRTVFILAFTALAMVANGCDLLLPWHPFSWYGFGATLGGTVTQVDDIAAGSGLRTGDVIDVTRLTLDRRARFGYFNDALENSSLRLHMVSGRDVTVRSHPYARSLADNLTDVIAVLALLFFAALAAALVLLRPMPSTWAFYVFSFPLFYAGGGTLFQQYIPFAAEVPVAMLFRISFIAGGAALVAFALRFPNEPVKGAGRWLERIAIASAAAAVCLFIGVRLNYIFGAHLPPGWAVAFLLSVQFAPIIVGIAVLLVRYAMSSSANRNRMQWVVGAFAVAFLPIMAIGFTQTALSLFPEVSYINLAQAWSLIAPAALAYTILKHRLYDVRFIFSRALVYGLLTSVTVALLALVDWGFGRWLAQSRFALVAELCLAVGIGVMLTTAHKRTEHFLNNVIFRAQTLALQALRRFAQETDLIADPQHLVGQTYEALHSRLESDYAAIYTADGSAYSLATPAVSATPAILSSHDFAVLRLRRWHEPFECDEPEHPLRGALLVPMTARGQLVGFVACGPKRDRTHYLPEEVETLSLLTHRMGSAYALLTLASAAPAVGALT